MGSEDKPPDVTYETELERVRQFKYDRLVALKFSRGDAAILAELDCDVHQVTDLILAGCPHDQAIQIVS